MKERVSMDEVEAEDAVSLPNKEVMSLLDVNANVDLGLDLAAPVDLAAAANLNVAAPIEASAAANVLSPDAQAVSAAQQHGSIDQGISGSATATAPQHASIAQSSDTVGGTGSSDTGSAAPAQATSGTAGAAPSAADGAPSGGPAVTTLPGDAAPAAATTRRRQPRLLPRRPTPRSRRHRQERAPVALTARRRCNGRSRRRDRRGRRGNGRSRRRNRRGRRCHGRSDGCSRRRNRRGRRVPQARSTARAVQSAGSPTRPATPSAARRAVSTRS